jgi:hypothetical protein
MTASAGSSAREACSRIASGLDPWQTHTVHSVPVRRRIVAEDLGRDLGVRGAAGM